MTDKALRSRLTRLAHERPEFRKDLLPLLGKTAASARVLMRYMALEKHLKSQGDREGLDLLSDFADVVGL